MAKDSSEERDTSRITTKSREIERKKVGQRARERDR